MPPTPVKRKRTTIPIYSVVGIIEEGDLFLTVARKDDPEDLGFPGGKLEVGETPEEAIVRELREETGILVARRHLRTSLVAADEAGRLCMAFDVLDYRGTPSCREGAWVGWTEPSRLVDGRNTFRAFNAALFQHKGISVQTEAIQAPSPIAHSLPQALKVLTGIDAYPRGHITFLYGPSALAFCPTNSIHQPRLRFDRRQFLGLLTDEVFAIRTHLQLSLVPRNLFRHLHALGNRCASAVLALSPHRPPADWEAVSSNVIECMPHALGTQLILMKNRAAAGVVGASVVVSKGLETTTVGP